MFLALMLKPSWVRIDDTAAQLFPKFQGHRSKAFEVMIQKVIKLLSAKAVLFYFQLHYRCDPMR